jgi:hypothetical protein
MAGFVASRLVAIIKDGFKLCGKARCYYIKDGWLRGFKARCYYKRWLQTFKARCSYLKDGVVASWLVDII